MPNYERIEANEGKIMVVSQLLFAIIATFVWSWPLSADEQRSAPSPNEVMNEDIWDSTHPVREIAGITIGKLKSQEVIEGNGCSLTSRYGIQPDAYFWTDGSERGLFRLNRQDVDATLTKSTKSKTRCEKGNHYTESYQWEDTNLTIDHTITSTKSKGHEPCESIETDAILVAQRGNSKQIQRLKGFCGRLMRWTSGSLRTTDQDLQTKTIEKALNSSDFLSGTKTPQELRAKIDQVFTGTLADAEYNQMVPHINKEVASPYRKNKGITFTEDWEAPNSARIASVDYVDIDIDPEALRQVTFHISLIKNGWRIDRQKYGGFKTVAVGPEATERGSPQTVFTNTACGYEITFPTLVNLPVFIEEFNLTGYANDSWGLSLFEDPSKFKTFISDQHTEGMLKYDEKENQWRYEVPPPIPFLCPKKRGPIFGGIFAYRVGDVMRGQGRAYAVISKKCAFVLETPNFGPEAVKVKFNHPGDLLDVTCQ